jgi:hypothetical protein
VRPYLSKNLKAMRAGSVAQIVWHLHKALSLNSSTSKKKKKKSENSSWNVKCDYCVG